MQQLLNNFTELQRRALRRLRQAGCLEQTNKLSARQCLIDRPRNMELTWLIHEAADPRWMGLDLTLAA